MNKPTDQGDVVSPISDVQGYLDKMGRSIFDKLFAFDVGADVYVDYGCADGTLLKLVARLFPESTYIGYDKDPKMIEAAQRDGGTSNLTFTSDWKALSLVINAAKNGKSDLKTCVLLFSVIHEVYSYDRDAVSDFWKRVFGEEEGSPVFDYVVVRDMAVSRTASRASDPITVARVRQLFDQHKISQWEAQWGSLGENWSFVHFLLTYHYDANWERELRENYLPLPFEDLIRIFPKEYFPIFTSHYSLPYLRRKVRDDFGFDFQEPTHVKLAMERR